MKNFFSSVVSALKFFSSVASALSVHMTGQHSCRRIHLQFPGFGLSRFNIFGIPEFCSKNFVAGAERPLLLLIRRNLISFVHSKWNDVFRGTLIGDLAQNVSWMEPNFAKIVKILICIGTTDFNFS